jgi:hypothetical protein
LRSIIHRNVTRGLGGADACALKRAPHHAAQPETIYDGRRSGRHAASRDRQCARDALSDIQSAELRRVETLDHAIGTFDGECVCAIGLDSVPVTALGWVGRLRLSCALKQAPHRSDAEKNAYDGTEPKPEHA